MKSNGQLDTSLPFGRRVRVGAINQGIIGMWLIFKAIRLDKITVSVRVPAGNSWHRVNKGTIYKVVSKCSRNHEGK